MAGQQNGDEDCRAAYSMPIGRDVAIVALLWLCTAVFAAAFMDFAVPPAEDAAMLMRYADHLARGAGIVWNIGEAPLDGATDFLFMVAAAALAKLGLSVELAVRSLTLGAHFLTIALVYWSLRRFQKAPMIVAVICSAYVALGPAIRLAAIYFGTAVFGLAVGCTWVLAQGIMLRGRRSWSYCTLFSVSALVTGLIRPEGVLICSFMVIAILFVVPAQVGRRAVLTFAGIFLVLGGGYFLWRWSYFGWPLPNPFYKKGGGLYPDSFAIAAWNAFRMAYFIVPVLLLALVGRNSRRLAIAMAVPMVGATAIWIMLSNEMNLMARFQYPVLLLAVLSWFPLLSAIDVEAWPAPWRRLGGTKGLLVGGIAALVFLGAAMELRRSLRPSVESPGLYRVAQALSAYASDGYTIVASEAGLLPFYSRWRAIDSWGLNDSWIAHNGIITLDYLERQKPDVIMFHASFSPAHPPPATSRSPWVKHTLVLHAYAEKHGYTLAAVYGRTPRNTHYYYVRRDLPHHDEIVRKIRSVAYQWSKWDRRTKDYASPAQ